MHSGVGVLRAEIIVYHPDKNAHVKHIHVHMHEGEIHLKVLGLKI